MHLLNRPAPSPPTAAARSAPATNRPPTLLQYPDGSTFCEECPPGRCEDPTVETCTILNTDSCLLYNVANCTTTYEACDPVQPKHICDVTGFAFYDAQW